MGGKRYSITDSSMKAFLSAAIFMAALSLVVFISSPAYASNLGSLGSGLIGSLNNVVGGFLNTGNNLLNSFLNFAFGANASQCGVAGNTVGVIVCNIVTSVQLVPGLFTAFSYVFGLVLGITGIQKLYEHVQTPNQVPPWEFIKRFIAGGAFFALPMVLEVAKNTLTGGLSMQYDVTGVPSNTSGGGLDSMMVGFMKDVFHPMWSAVAAFTYLAGIILVIIGISRLLKSAQEGPRGPGGFGTIMTFLTAGMLLSLDTMLNNFSISLFDPAGSQAQIVTNPILANTAGMSAVEVDHVRSVIGAVMVFMMILGWISFVRGIFIIRDVAEGNQQASMMAGITHMLGGALALNLGSVINAVQTTLGLSGFGVTFQ